MDISSRLELAISSNEADPPIGLIVGMRISAGTKNPYRIYFPKTDESGRTTLDKAAILGQFKDHWEEGLMDFNGTLESAGQTATFFLFNVRELQTHLDRAMAWPLFTHEKTVWQSRSEQVSYFLSCCNSQYSLPETDLPIPTDGLLHLQVHRHEV
jgi:hypothetical protein